MPIRRKQKGWLVTDISNCNPESPNGILHAKGYTRKTLMDKVPSLKRFYKANKLVIELRTVAQAREFIKTLEKKVGNE